MKIRIRLSVCGTLLLFSTLLVTGGAASAQTPNRPAPAGQQQPPPPPPLPTHKKFDAKDRQMVRQWWDTHKNKPPIGLREKDTLAPDVQAKLKVGIVLDGELRAKIRALPLEVLQSLGQPAPGYHYLLIGGQIVFVDINNNVQDIMNVVKMP